MSDTELPPARKILFVGRYAILDEHVLPANSSHPTVTVDAKRLQLIADNCNQRIKDTGDQIPLVLGHTDDEAMETDQPPVVGFADNFSLAPLFNTGRMAIWADFHIYEDSISEARKYPRRSVELWASKNIIDPISLLSASTPERDLGLMKFQRKETPYRYTLDMDEEMPDDKKDMKAAETKVTNTDGITVEAVIAALMQTPLFKQLEAMVESAANEEPDGDEGMPQEDMQDAPMMPPEGKEPEGKEAAKFNEPAPVRFQEAMASGTNTCPPEMIKEAKKYKMTPETDKDLAIKYSKLESRMSVIEAENRVLKQRDEEITLRYKKDHAARLFETLEAEGYDVDDSDKMLLEELGADNQVKHANIIRAKYRKAPVGPNLELTDAIKYSRSADETLAPKSAEDVQKIASLATAQGLNFTQATAKFYGKA